MISTQLNILIFFKHKWHNQNYFKTEFLKILNTLVKIFQVFIMIKLRIMKKTTVHAPVLDKNHVLLNIYLIIVNKIDRATFIIIILLQINKVQENKIIIIIFSSQKIISINKAQKSRIIFFSSQKIISHKQKGQIVELRW